MSSTRRRVVLFSPSWPATVHANGIVTYVQHLREGLGEQGVETRVMTSRLAESNQDPGVVEVCSQPASKSWPTRLRSMSTGWMGGLTVPYDFGCRVRDSLQALHRQWPFDIFEVEESFGISWQGRPPSSAAVVVRLHGPWFLNGAAVGAPDGPAFRWRQWLEKRAIATADAVTSPSHDVLRRVREHYRLALPHAHVVPNPGPCADEQSRWRLDAARARQVLFVGRFDRHKGGDVMLDAFARLVRRHPDAELLFAGPDAACVTDSGRRLGLQAYLLEHVPAEARDRVRVLGVQPREAVEALRRQAFMTIVPSRYETFSMTTLEAMAAGSPLVAAAAGAIPELVTHEETGLLVPPGDADALAHAMSRLFESPELAARLGSQAAAEVPMRFGRESVAKRTAEVYDEVLERKVSLRRATVR